MRILYVISRYPTLSTTFVLHEIALMRALGHEVRVCSFRPPSRGDAEAVEGSGIWVAPTLGPPKTINTLLNALRARLPERAEATAPWRELMAERLAFGGLGAWVGDVARAFGADYIHAQFANVAATSAWAASQATGIPFGFTAHAHDIFHKRNPWLGAKTRAAALPVTVSEHHRRHLIDRLGPGTGGRFEVVRCGVDLAAFAPGAAAPTHDVSAVGRLVEKKGFDVLIRAIARMPEPRPRCHIIGEGPARRALEQEIARCGVGDAVRLLGALPNAQVCDEVARAQLFVLPCRVAADGDRDGLPVVLMEALALGKPAISTPVAGIPELIQDGRTGLLVEIDHPDQLAAGITRLLQDRALARRLAAAGRAHVESSYDVRQNVSDLARRIARRIGGSHSRQDTDRTRT